MDNLKERVIHWIARKLPRSVRYWAVIVAGAEATTRAPLSSANVPDITFMDVLKHLEPRP